MVGAALPAGYQLPPGFRFHPTDQELILQYLQKRLSSSLCPLSSIIAEIDLYKYNPWDLPGKAFFGEGEWFFFSPRDRKYPNGARPNRAAGSGYWKATGTDKPILATGSSQCLGVKKALVFYKGRPPKGIKTDWVMHEYRLLDASPDACPPKNKASMRLDDWVLCRVRHKSSEPQQAKDDHLTPNLSPNLTNQHVLEKQSNTNKEKSCWFEQTDYQFLAFLMGSQDVGDSTSDLTYHPTFLQEMGTTSGVEEAQSLHLVLDNMKRKLSFGALDELLMSPPNKRLNYCFDSSALDPFSMMGSNPVDQIFYIS